MICRRLKSRQARRLLRLDRFPPMTDDGLGQNFPWHGSSFNGSTISRPGRLAEGVGLIIAMPGNRKFSAARKQLRSCHRSKSTVSHAHNRSPGNASRSIVKPTPRLQQCSATRPSNHSLSLRASHAKKSDADLSLALLIHLPCHHLLLFFDSISYKFIPTQPGWATGRSVKNQINSGDPPR